MIRNVRDVAEAGFIVVLSLILLCATFAVMAGCCLATLIGADLASVVLTPLPY